MMKPSAFPQFLLHAQHQAYSHRRHPARGAEESDESEGGGTCRPLPPAACRLELLRRSVLHRRRSKVGPSGVAESCPRRLAELVGAVIAISSVLGVVAA